MVLSVAGAQETKARKANAGRLTYKGEVAYLVTAGKTSDQPFTGTAFWEESWGRAEMEFVDGIPHGEVTVINNNKLLYRFRYEQGKKVLE